jgi:hypothetical protein
MIDWVMSDSQKRRLRSKTEDLWLWLAAQNAGRFLTVVRNQRTQFWLSIAAHILLIFIVSGVILRVYFGVPIDAHLDLGFPRIYRCQIFVDSLALIVSAVIVSVRIHPAIVRRITSASSTPTYLWSTTKIFLLIILIAAALLVALMLPLSSSYREAMDIAGVSSADFGSGSEKYQQFVSMVESAYGGQAGVITLHCVSAFVVAPVIAEGMLVQTILFLSIYWLFGVLLLTALLKIAEFVVYRLATYEKGPVLAVAALLAALGAIFKALA